MVVSAGRGSERVEGRFSPGKDVKKTFNVDGKSMIDVCWLRRLVKGEMADHL